MYEMFCFYAGTVFAYGVTSSGKTHTMHVSYYLGITCTEFVTVMSSLAFCWELHTGLLVMPVGPADALDSCHGRN
jgi:hypothetical protein